MVSEILAPFYSEELSDWHLVTYKQIKSGKSYKISILGTSRTVMYSTYVEKFRLQEHVLKDGITKHAT